jgi:hypothetical protein
MMIVDILVLAAAWRPAIAPRRPALAAVREGAPTGPAA